TLDFTACEVEAPGHLFEPRRPKPFDEDYSISFRLNPLHDMESIWWIATWTLLPC
ncbi:hypothetical protein EDD16DRAFT_1608939, partial [Pisolithus croceorrhizus]